ncbi:MAG TPA: BTAD domain-containing putative transcriptional regulator [Gemmatimonadaceae bacterium]|nr:BTAD domain-containing putative transcriptional regulator [Gemmatimonadaceae bacterium]
MDHSHNLGEHRRELVRDAEGQGAYDHAARWWRWRAADDPLNARVAIALMRALAAAGDPAGALRHAGIFEALVKEELDLPIEREVRELAESLRRQIADRRTPVRPTDSNVATVSGRAARIALAVLPLADLGDASTASTSAQWREALADELITALAAVPTLKVSSRSASWPFGVSPDISALRTTLGVTLALEGSIRRSESRVRVTLWLVDTSDGHTVWAERFERGDGDPFDLHAELASLVATRVRESLA